MLYFKLIPLNNANGNTIATEVSCTYTFSLRFFLGKRAILRGRQQLENNYYSVPIHIQDRHGISAKHILSVRVCDCTIPSECRMSVVDDRDVKVPSSNVILGKWAILAMILGSALLLCKCHYLKVLTKILPNSHVLAYFTIKKKSNCGNS